MAWLYAWNLYDYVSEEIIVEQDAQDGDNANYIGNDGDILNCVGAHPNVTKQGCCILFSDNIHDVYVSACQVTFTYKQNIKSALTELQKAIVV